jgi:hypothetical protein
MNALGSRLAISSRTQPKIPVTAMIVPFNVKNPLVPLTLPWDETFDIGSNTALPRHLPKDNAG